MADAPRPIEPRHKPRRKRRSLRAVSVLRLVFLLLIYGASLGASALYYAVTVINADLPADMTKLLDYEPSRKSVVLASDGSEVGTFSVENRSIVRLERMPPHLVAAFLSAEDRRFYRHGGFDLIGILRAAWTTSAAAVRSSRAARR